MGEETLDILPDGRRKLACRQCELNTVTSHSALSNVPSVQLRRAPELVENSASVVLEPRVAKNYGISARILSS